MLNNRFQTVSWRSAIAALLLLSASCAHQSQTGSGATASSPPSGDQAGSEQIVLRKMAAGKEFSGFLKDYSKLKPNPNLGGNALTFAKPDEQRNLHKYIAMIVDPVQVYLASDADESKLPEKARGVGARYFHNALVETVSAAFPVVDHSGPLVLRLRTAIVGVDVGGEIPAADRPTNAEDALDRGINIGKVGVEMELVDSETGEQIAAMVDRENLGSGAEIGAVNFSKQEKYAAAREAFDGWAQRVREFLNSAHELSAEDAKRADQSYRPYGEEEAKQ
jgi:hypothetical protein